MLKTCSVKKIPFNFFLLSLKRQTPVSLLITAFLLLICPGMLVGNILAAYDDFVYTGLPYSFNHEFPSVAIIIFIVSLVAMLILVLSNFGFLYSKKAGDLYHSLPLTKNQLFIIKTAASFVGAFFTLAVSFGALVTINVLPFVKGISLKECGEYFLSMTLLLLLCTCFTALFATLSSSYFNFIVSLGSVSVALPLIVILVCYWLEQGYGIVVSRLSTIYTSPYLYAVVKLMAQERHIDDVSEFSIVSFVCCILFSLLFIGLSLFFFKKRKTETAEQPFSFKFVNVITLICVSLCGGVFIGTVFSLGELQSLSFWLFLLFGAIICAIAVGAIQNKNFKTVLKSLVLGCIAFFTVLAVFVGTKVYTAYAARFVPDFENIESITVNDDLVMLSDIDTILQIHKTAIKDIDAPTTSYAEFVYSYDIEYTLRNGRRIRRHYTLYNNALNLAYLKSETRLAFYDNPIIPDDTDVSVYSDKNEDYASYRLTDEQYRALLSAYAKDIRKASPDVFYEDRVYISGRVARDDYGTLNIYESYENTRAYIEYLKENGKKAY